MKERVAVLVALAGGLAAFSLGAPSAGASTPATSVINGNEAVQGQFPFMAFVEDKTEEGFVDQCSGTVVSSNVILTAAHCVVNREEATIYPPEGFTVRTGNVFRGLGSTSSVTRIAVLPGYTWRGEEPGPGDAAALQLSAPVSAPAVAVSSAPPAARTNVVMAGWGRLSANGAAPLALHWGETVVQSPEYCAGQIPSFDSAAQLCVLDYPTDEYGPCHGDSGGPLLTLVSGTFTEVGITSYGDTNCPTNRPSVYTQSSSVAPWLATKIAEWAPPPPPPPVAPSTPSSSPSPPVATSSGQVVSSPPPPVLPQMTPGAAVRYAREGLAEGLGYRFNRHRRLRITCTAVTTSGRRCVASWEANAFSYSGTVSVYYLLEGATLVWGDRFRINRIPTRCFRSCRPTVFRSP